MNAELRQKNGDQVHDAEGDPALSPFYIQAPLPLADEQTRVLKHGDTFAVFDRHGDIKPGGTGEEGLYHDGTRYLSCCILLLGKHRPQFLSSTVKEDNDLLTIDLTNPDLLVGDQVAVPRGTLHIFRSKFLADASCFERIRVKNFGLANVDVDLSLHFRADFADIFEVRGTHRAARGKLGGASVNGHAVHLGYEGLDGVRRQTRLAFGPSPPAPLPSGERGDLSSALLPNAERGNSDPSFSVVHATHASFRAVLPPHGEAFFDIVISCEHGQAAPSVLTFEAAHAGAALMLTARRQACVVCTSDARFNDWLNRAAADLAMMTTQTSLGSYPYAGVPWFSTPFGRDGLLTALECLWVEPALARGVLAFLAQTQATEFNPAQDAEPGKILHEARGGEMAALGEVPFQRYYGSVDATPLFVCLAGAYYRRTVDRDFIRSIRQHVQRALDWIDGRGDPDGDGFVEYHRQSPKGLDQQGWKDSHDSVFHADGALAPPPIALCEVQGYVYAARLAAAELADAFGEITQATEHRHRAAVLKERFAQAFWCEDLGTYALALDGSKRPCRVRTSNPGHCLWTGIATPERGRRAGAKLLEDVHFTGWGIRTVAHGEARYNPMSYHNGSIWPHDNALAAAGLARYGLRDEAERVLTAMFDVSKAVDLHRLPELFCGFHRRPGEGPTRYPVACAPQSWSAAAVFLLLEACLGVSIQAAPPIICFTAPRLPDYLRELSITNLRIGGATIDLRLRAADDEVAVELVRGEGDVEVRIEK